MYHFSFHLSNTRATAAKCQRITQPGAAFDPHQHEAIAGHAADVAHDTVVDVAQNGYTFEGQVLRPARVVVATPAPTDGEATGQEVSGA